MSTHHSTSFQPTTSHILTLQLQHNTGNVFRVHVRNFKLSWAYPASCSKWIRGSSFGINRPVRETEHLTISSTEAENEWLYASTPLICIQGNHGCHLSSQTCVYEMQVKGELQSLSVLFAAPCVLISCWCSSESFILVCSTSSAFFLDALRLRVFHSSQSFKSTAMKKIICPQGYLLLLPMHAGQNVFNNDWNYH